MTRSLQATAEVEILPSLTAAEELFAEGRGIGRRFEGGLKASLFNFYMEALPYAERVRRERPWEKAEFSYLRETDEDRSFLRFLRTSFTDEMETMAYHQAVIVKMMLDNGWDFQTIEGIGLKRLWRISNVIKLINQADQQKLLEAAKSSPYREFDEVCKGIKRGYALEPIKDKLISAPESGILQVNEFLEASKKAGDTRMEGEIIADALGGMLNTDPEFNHHVWSNQIVSLFCEIIRYFNTDAKAKSNSDIVASYAVEFMHSMADELPEYLFKRYRVLVGHQIVEVIDEPDD